MCFLSSISSPFPDGLREKIRFQTFMYQYSTNTHRTTPPLLYNPFLAHRCCLIFFEFECCAFSKHNPARGLHELAAQEARAAV